MGLKEKIRQQIAEPAVHNRSSQYTVAKVTQSNEKNNTCSISFIDKNGQPRTASGVQMRLYNQSMIDWFPKVNELVNINDSGGIYEIVSKYTENYAATARCGTELKRDIHSSICNSTGGFIL
jgi:hypothetical protein